MPGVTPRTWGFRLSAVDIAVLVAAGPLTWWLWGRIGGMAGAVPLAVGHFFLFCNVIRIIRWKELVWAIFAVLNVAISAAMSEEVPWLTVIVIQTPLTIALVWTEVRSARYHGILARRLNSRLDEYLHGRA